MLMLLLLRFVFATWPSAEVLGIHWHGCDHMQMLPCVVFVEFS